jgi:hypothetical protein
LFVSIFALKNFFSKGMESTQATASHCVQQHWHCAVLPQLSALGAQHKIVLAGQQPTLECSYIASQYMRHYTRSGNPIHELAGGSYGGEDKNQLPTHQVSSACSAGEPGLQCTRAAVVLAAAAMAKFHHHHVTNQAMAKFKVATVALWCLHSATPA